MYGNSISSKSNFHDDDDGYNHFGNSPSDRQPGFGGDPGKPGAANKGEQVQKEVDEVVGIMQQNMNKVMDRQEHLSNLQARSENLQGEAYNFYIGASAVHKKMWWKNMRLKIIIAVVVVILIIVIVVPVVVSKKG
ncbi:Vesicle membrane receptor protein (v-SNARE) [Coemansia sp. Benny D115]|nr:Vesicle membrane receptor protein (v-SNARE) [Coemansia sp. Benny D115]